MRGWKLGIVKTENSSDSPGINVSYTLGLLRLKNLKMKEKNLTGLIFLGVCISAHPLVNIRMVLGYPNHYTLFIGRT